MINQQKKASFEFYTYELTPTTTNTGLFTSYFLESLGIDSIEELREKKNDFFSSAFSSDLFYFKYKKTQLKHKILYSENNYILIQVANKKNVKAEIGFKTVLYPNEPSILICIDNRNDEQQIAIEYAPNVFATTTGVAKMLSEALERILPKYLLTVKINNRYNPQDFWKLLSENQGRVRELKIELTRENLADIYKSISKQLIDYGESTNSESMTITQQAPKGGVLENLNPQNENLNDIVTASAKGTGPITVKFVGDNKRHSTTDKKLVNTVHYEIGAEGLTVEQAKELIESVFKHI